MTPARHQTLQQLTILVGSMRTGGNDPLGTLDRRPARRLRDDDAARS